MLRNVASQTIAANLASKTDGSAVTSGTTTVYVTKDGGTQFSIGTATHEGNGEWSIVPAATNTDAAHCAFTFVNTNSVNVTLNVYPQTDIGSNAEIAASNAALLASRLTATRAGYLDLIPQAASNASNIWLQIQTDASNILANASNIAVLQARLTATRAGYLDQIPQAASNASNIWLQAQIDASNILANASNIATLLSRLSATRAGYLDLIPQAASNASNTWLQIQTDASNILVLASNMSVLLTTVGPGSSATNIALLVLTSAIDSTYNLKQYIEAIGSAVAGKSSGVAAGSPVFRNLADARNVVSGTASSGDRTVSTINPTP